MKPRIYKFRGLWRCAMTGSVMYGIGYSPADAYEDWIRHVCPWGVA